VLAMGAYIPGLAPVHICGVFEMLR